MRALRLCSTSAPPISCSGGPNAVLYEATQLDNGETEVTYSMIDHGGTATINPQPTYETTGPLGQLGAQAFLLPAHMTHAAPNSIDPASYSLGAGGAAPSGAALYATTDTEFGGFGHESVPAPVWSGARPRVTGGCLASQPLMARAACGRIVAFRDAVRGSNTSASSGHQPAPAPAPLCAG